MERPLFAISWVCRLNRYGLTSTFYGPIRFFVSFNVCVRELTAGLMEEARNCFGYKLLSGDWRVMGERKIKGGEEEGSYCAGVEVIGSVGGRVVSAEP